MTLINRGRVVVGGLLAGLVITIGEFLFNGVLFAADLEAAMARLNLPPVSGGAVALFVAISFVLGIATVWLYAAIRPRFGAGVQTALCAAAYVWALAYAFPSVGYVAMGFFPASLIGAGLAWGLVELLIAGVAGAWLYQESAAAPARHAAV